VDCTSAIHRRKPWPFAAEPIERFLFFYFLLRFAITSGRNFRRYASIAKIPGLLSPRLALLVLGMIVHFKNFKSCGDLDFPDCTAWLVDMES
jgi:hypothetical protein